MGLNLFHIPLFFYYYSRGGTLRNWHGQNPCLVCFPLIIFFHSGPRDIAGWNATTTHTYRHWPLSSNTPSILICIQGELRVVSPCKISPPHTHKQKFTFSPTNNNSQQPNNSLLSPSKQIDRQTDRQTQTQTLATVRVPIYHVRF